MNSLALGSGDNNHPSVSTTAEGNNEQNEIPKDTKGYDDNGKLNQEIPNVQTIDDNELKLRERIAHCKNIIESLKCELNEEKAKIERESNTHSPQTVPECAVEITSENQNISLSDILDLGDYNIDQYSACVDRKLSYDKNLMEYEKQLQKYQNTLNMAQIEKKNAIRKQMLAKAYKLKLLEVENQCNIELLRVKQSIQCLEPLQIIANKWKTNTEDSMHDFNNFELISRYPELSPRSNVSNEVVNVNSKEQDPENI